MDYTTKGFVALIDVLGFNSFEHKKQLSVVELITHFVDDLLPKMSQLRPEQYQRWLSAPITMAYSDTIVIAFPLNPERRIAQDAFYWINTIIGKLQALFLLDGILLRGAVGYGELHLWKYGVFGSAVSDVKDEFESTDWSGVHYGTRACSIAANWLKYKFDNDVEDKRTVPGTNLSLLYTNFIPWSVPFKENTRTNQLRMVVPWPQEIALVCTVENIILENSPTPSTRIQNAVEPLMSSGNKELVKKGINTLEFTDWFFNKYPDFNIVPEIRGQLPPMDLI